MTIEQRKISLINWIANIEDDNVIKSIEDFRKISLDELPKEVIKLLKISDTENIEECIEHTSARVLLNKK